MFHSTGMPFGLLMPMKPWKLVIRIRPRTVGIGWPAPRIRRTGIEYSAAVPKCAIVAAKRDGRRSSGKWVKRLFFKALGKKGPLFIMNMMTDGKCWLSFEVAAQNQMKHQVSFAPEIQRSFPLATAMQTSTT